MRAGGEKVPGKLSLDVGMSQTEGDSQASGEAGSVMSCREVMLSVRMLEPFADA